MLDLALLRNVTFHHAAGHGGAAALGGAVNTFRQLGYALGVAVLGAVFRGGLEHTVGHAPWQASSAAVRPPQ